MTLKTSRRLIVVLAAVVIIVLVVVSSFVFLYHNSSSEKLESITIGHIPYIGDELFLVAENQSFFMQNGLNVTFRDYSVGAAAVTGLSKGEVDFSLSNEFPVAKSIMGKNNLSVVTTIDQLGTIYLTARTDKGIEGASDLLGKRIGVTLGAITEFYLGRYLSLNNLSIDNITEVNLQPAQFVNALVNGSIDGFVDDIGRFNLAQEQLGNTLVKLPVQAGQPAFYSISCKSDFISNHPQTINKLLNSLYQAETYTLQHSSQAQSITQNKLNLTSTDLVAWPDHSFSLSLEQSIVTAMKDEGQWLVTNHLTNQTALPNFSDYVYTDGLKAVKPQSVTVIK